MSFATSSYRFRLPSEVRCRLSSCGSTGSRVIHHANLRIDPTVGSRWLDAEDPLAGYEGAVSPERAISRWVLSRLDPGPDAARAPRRHGLAAARRASTWSCSSSAQVREAGARAASVAFYFTDVRLSAAAGDTARAAESRYRRGRDVVARDSYTPPVTSNCTRFTRTRTIARTMSRRLPAARRHSATLIEIADWDFNWQDVYRFASR